MFCRNCGTQNPENAVFCRNCGAKLKEDVKKAEVIETPASNRQNSDYTQTTTTSTTSKSDSTGWIACCCIGLFLIFIISALFSGF